MIIKSNLSLDEISNMLDVIECAMQGKPHTFNVFISSNKEQRRLWSIAHRTAFYPKQPAVVSEQTTKENNMGYGEGRYMGD